MRSLIDRRLYLLFTAELCARAPLATLSGALDGGVDAVQFREKRIDTATRRLLRDVLAQCRSRGVPCIVNDHVELALETAIRSMPRRVSSGMRASVIPPIAKTGTSTAIRIAATASGPRPAAYPRVAVAKHGPAPMWSAPARTAATACAGS